MKVLQLLPLICLLMFSCNHKPDKSIATKTTDDAEHSKRNLEGAWELVGYYNYVDNKVTDSFDLSKGYKQVKIYTPTKVMWSKSVPLDSTEWFGYGSYDIEGTELVEVLDYGSEMMTKIIQEKKKFTYELDYNNKSFSQIEIDENGNRIYSENYVRIE